MSTRRASTSDAAGNSDLSKLHAMEAVRAKEMQTHGELVQQLQTQLASSRQNEKELQLTVAKLRAEKCRLDAEATSSSSKLRGLEAKTEASERQRERSADDFRQRLLTKEDEIAKLHATIHGLKQQQHATAITDTERTAVMETLRRELERITTERDDARLASTASAQEITQLATRLAVKHTELDTERAKCEQLRHDLEILKNERVDQANQLQLLSRTCGRLEITRLRLAAWGQARIKLMESDVRFRDVFLEWKAQALVSKVTRSRQLQHEVQQRRDQMVSIRNELDKKLKTTRVTLEAMKTCLESQRQDIRSWHDVCASQFSSLILTKFQQAQTETIRLCDDKVAALSNQLNMEKAQHESAIEQSRQLLQSSRTTFKRQVSALLHRISMVQVQQLRAQAFQGWKDVYLRNVVAETTHAVMVARAARCMAAAAPCQDPLRADTHLQKGKSAVESPTKVQSKLSRGSFRQPQLTVDPFSLVDEDEQWKRWRRVAPTDTRVLSSKTRRSSITSTTSTTPSTPPTLPATTSTDSSVSSSSRRRASIM